MGIDSKYVKEHLIPEWYTGNQNDKNDYDYENSLSLSNETN